MSGRDVIAIARLPGKTMGYTLPMVRHAMDQPRLAAGEGPIGLVMVPTRELALQVYREVKKFASVAGLGVAAVYGGTNQKEVIAELKRGAELVVCTPGRMIDMLTANSGRVTNLRRVTYVVLDEADRMFDMGFAPQIDKILAGTRPDRQTLLFSATFPKTIEKLARAVLTKPVQIVAGGVSVVSSTIEQHAEVLSADAKLPRLCQLLRHHYDEGQQLVFVDTQEACDTLFRELLKQSLPCTTLHGGMSQADRDATISDFKSGAIGVLIATSVAARGLDVKGLICVVNYEAPNHYEDYVHRVGRTGRAGNTGVAYTFLTPGEEKFAPDLVRAMEAAGQEAPDEIVCMANAHSARRGRAQAGRLPHLGLQGGPRHRARRRGARGGGARAEGGAQGGEARGGRGGRRGGGGGVGRRRRARRGQTPAGRRAALGARCPARRAAAAAAAAAAAPRAMESRRRRRRRPLRRPGRGEGGTGAAAAAGQRKAAVGAAGRARPAAARRPRRMRACRRCRPPPSPRSRRSATGRRRWCRIPTPRRRRSRPRRRRRPRFRARCSPRGAARRRATRRSSRSTTIRSRRA